MFLFAWMFLFGLLFLFFYWHDKSQDGESRVERGMVTIKADKQGHYRIKGTINDKPVEFMVDTGASLVAIPRTMADDMHLIGRYPITLDTANGQATGLLTRLEKLTFGDFQLTDIKAVILPGDDDTVLLGMNVLSLFNLSQKGKQLVIQK